MKYGNIILAIVVITFMYIRITGIEAKIINIGKEITETNKQVDLRLDYLEELTKSPRVSVLAEELGLSIGVGGGSAISISKLIVEDVGLNTLIRAEVMNRSSRDITYVVSNKTPARVVSGYTKLTSDDNYVVVPLTNVINVASGATGTIVIQVSKIASDKKDIVIGDTQFHETWISVIEQATNGINAELIMRILIRG